MGAPAGEYLNHIILRVTITHENVGGQEVLDGESSLPTTLGGTETLAVPGLVN